MAGSYSEYMGGMDENGHEAKDNFTRYDTSMSLRLEGAKGIGDSRLNEIMRIIEKYTTAKDPSTVVCGCNIKL